ncbi:hypothetical protein ABZP36_027989 [Zizania latifolia]
MHPRFAAAISTASPKRACRKENRVSKAAAAPAAAKNRELVGRQAVSGGTTASLAQKTAPHGSTRPRACLGPRAKLLNRPWHLLRRLLPSANCRPKTRVLLLSRVANHVFARGKAGRWSQSSSRGPINHPNDSKRANPSSIPELASGSGPRWGQSVS